MIRLEIIYRKYANGAFDEFDILVPEEKIT